MHVFGKKLKAGSTATLERILICKKTSKVGKITTITTEKS